MALLISASVSVALPACPSDQTKRYHNCFGTYTFANGEKYIGGYKDSKFSGQGFYIWKSGKADFCLYVDNEGSNCSGSNVYDVAPVLTDKFRQLSEYQRREIQSNLKSMDLYSSTIDGKWGRGTFVGLASYAALNLKTVNINNYLTANTLFQKVMGVDSPGNGTCPDDEAAVWDNCIGEITFNDGSKYVGQWKANTRNGQGTYTFANGNKYVGEFKDGKRNGQGTYTYGPNSEWAGDKYVGGSKNSKRNGQGTYTYANGDKYIGDFKNGGYNGQGTYTYANGNKYVGEYKDDKRNGQGTFTFANGENYAGNFINGDFNGQGTYTYANGNKYVGEFKNDKRNGQGTLTYVSGTIEEGIWKDGELQYAQASPEVLETDDTSENLEVSSGTGFYVSNEGHIITNHHVIDGCMDMKVHTKGRILPTLRIADDKQNDLALLKISETPSYVFALSNTSPYPLQDIVVAGFPFGDRYSSTLKFTKGIVSSLAGMGDNYSEIQIDAALQQGNSGGPIIDEYGNVVAVAVAKLDAKYMFDNFGIIPENTNFGIKASAVRNLLEGNQVPLKIPATDVISKRDLSRLATDGTVYLTCWMTNAQLEQMKSKKVMFENFN